MTPAESHLSSASLSRELADVAHSPMWVSCPSPSLGISPPAASSRRSSSRGSSAAFSSYHTFRVEGRHRRLHSRLRIMLPRPQSGMKYPLLTSASIASRICKLRAALSLLETSSLERAGLSEGFPSAFGAGTMVACGGSSKTGDVLASNQGCSHSPSTAPKAGAESVLPSPGPSKAGK